MTKECLHCHDVLPLSEFSNKKPRCKICRNAVRLLDKMEAGEPVRYSSLFSLLPGSKLCYRCDRIMDDDAFYKDPRHSCKECHKEQYDEKWRLNIYSIPEKYVEVEEKTCAKCKQLKNSSCFSLDKYSEDKLTKQCKECASVQAKLTKSKNLEKYRENAARRAREKRKTASGSLKAKMTCSIYRHIKDGSFSKWEPILGYSIERLRQHLIGLMTEGMTECDLMTGKIHIDHKIPHAFFYYETIEDQDFKDCWALDNLRPMWASENTSKQDLMPDGSRAREHRKRKIALLNEEKSVAGWELHRKESSEEDFSA